MTSIGGTFRLTIGSYWGNQFSLGHYSSGWRGGSVAHIKTFSMTNVGKSIGRRTFIVGAALGVYLIANGYIQDGNSYGYNSQLATASFAGGLAGGLAGAEFGAYLGGTVGVWFGGVGAVPGAVIGGLVGGAIGGTVGGYYGSEAGAAVFGLFQKR